MKQRMILQPDTELSFDAGKGGTVTYTIQSVIGEGSLCVLYLASYQDNLGLTKQVKIKEYNPEQFHITRNENHEMELPGPEQDAFAALKDRVVHSYSAGHRLFYDERIANSISNAENIYFANGTVYMIYSYMKGEDLSNYQAASLQEAIQIAESTARTLQKIHEAGCLYLDLKPENVLILDGTRDLIQLFDFDSLIPVKSMADFAETRITFSRGFSPVEQRMGEYDRIGKHSDVYSMGALLYYLLFGTAPRASDCNRRKPYSFRTSRYDFFDYPDTLEKGISELLCHTLQSYPADRYPDMRPIVEELEKLEKLADDSAEFLRSSVPSVRRYLIGREEETARIHDWMSSEEKALIVTGMGGIGKTSVIIDAVQSAPDCFDAVSYMHYHGSVSETIADDRNLMLHNLKKEEEESVRDYAARKLAHMRRLCLEERILVILDHYEGGCIEELSELLDIGWKILIAARQMVTGQYPVMKLKEIPSLKKQKELFCFYYGERKPTAEENLLLTGMLGQIHGHTLSIELLAKQIRASCLSMEEAAQLLNTCGFSKIGKETVLYEKDGNAVYTSLSGIIGSLYDLRSVAPEQRDLLKMLSLFDIRGVDIRLFSEINRLDDREEINRLIRTGWIQTEENRIFLHSLIREAVRNAAWEDSNIRCFRCLLHELEKRLQPISDGRSSDENQNLEPYIAAGKMVLSNRNMRNIAGRRQFDNLWCFLAANLNRDDEGFILDCARTIRAEEIDSMQNLLKLWDISVRMLCEAGEMEQAEKLLAAGKEYLRHSCADSYAWAFYCGNIVVEYLETVLAARESRGIERRVIKKLLNANQKAMKFASQSEKAEARNLRARFAVDRTNFLIRTESAARKDILKILNQCKTLIAEMAYPEPEIEIAYALAHMWFHSVFDSNYRFAGAAWNRARKISERTGYPDLEKIDAIYIPGAEMELESAHFDRSLYLLQKGIAICEKHGDSIPYLRKKKELLEYILDVKLIEENN